MLVDKRLLPEGNHKLIKAYCYAVGIKKRCRSVDRHQFSVGYFTPDTDRNKIIKLAKETLGQMKSTAKAHVSISNTEIEIKSDMLIEKFSSSDVFDAEKFELV